MMEARAGHGASPGQEAHLPRDVLLGDVDWNDNTPVLVPLTADQMTQQRNQQLAVQHQKAKAATNVSPCKVSGQSLRSSTTSDHLPHAPAQAGHVAMPGVVYSPEDTLNNDFFFDDEFTVPFDANLSDGNTLDDMIDSKDIGALLSISKVYAANADNQAWHMPKMVTSKSDSCLYQADAEISGSDNMSQELSTSERDCASSSDLSDFRAEPLFSPSPEKRTTFSIEDASGLPNSNSHSREGELTTNSQHCDNHYDYDWRANKNQYMISFDKGKQYSSDESSYHESLSEINGSVTSWDKGAHSQVSWGSIAASKQNPYSCQAYDAEDDSGNSEHELDYFRSLSQPDSNEMTTWQILKTKKTKADGSSNGLVTWASLKKAHKEIKHEAASSNVRSKSMPDLEKKMYVSSMSDVSDGGSASGDHDYENYPPPVCRTTTEDAKERGVTNKSTSSDEKPSYTSTTSLFELFQRMKSHSSGESLGLGLDCNEAMISPTSLHRLTGTWSMSTISSSKKSCHSEESAGPSPTHTAAPPPTPGGSSSALVSWNTFKNLTDGLQNSDAHDEQLNDTLCGSKQKDEQLYDSFSDQGHQELEGNMVDVACGSHVVQKDLRSVSAQADSAVLVNRRESAIQCSIDKPPGLQECGVQTSVNDNEGVNRTIRTTSKALQTSFDKNEGGKNKAMQSSVTLSTTARDRWMKESYLKGIGLPDLSFLHKSSTGSNPRTRAHSADALSKSSKESSRTNIEPVTSISSPLSSSTPIKATKIPQKMKYPKDLSADFNRLSKERKNSAGSNNSICSSSSSGISSAYDSHTRLQYFADLSGTSDCASLSDSGSDYGSCNHRNGLLYKKSNNHIKGVQVPKVISNVCFVCNSNNKKDTVNNVQADVKDNSCASEMTFSHPVSSKKRKNRVTQNLKSLEYLLVSPTHPQKNKLAANNRKKPKSMIPVRNKQPQPSRLPILQKNQERFACTRSHSQPDSLDTQPNEENEKKPLKSCLVKRPNRRDKKSIMMKHRSWSDPSDALVMKYSLEGEVRYQLITASKQNPSPLSKEKDNKLDQIKETPSTPMPKDAHTNIAIQLSETLAKADTSKSLGTGETSTAKIPPIPPPKPPRALLQRFKKEAPPLQEESSPQSEAISPQQQIPMPDCTCHTAHAILHSSSESGSSENGRAKKSVSFCEQVSYHSPYTSPHDSPKKEPDNQTPKPVPVEEPIERIMPTPRPVQPELAAIIYGYKEEDHALEVEIESSCSSGPPSEFSMSPVESPTVSFAQSTEDIELWARKRELVLEVIRASELILNHFSQTRNPDEKVSLGSSSECPSVGHLVLKHLCPAVHAVMMDGLHPHTRSLFGRVKNTAWKVVEDSVASGLSSKMIKDLVKDLKNLHFLDSAWLRFNAFIFGLLNYKALDFWLTYIHCHESLISKNYSSASFLQLSCTTRGSHMFLDLTTALQPLAQMPFRLEYNFEFRQLERRQSEQMSAYLLNKHVAQSMDARLPDAQLRSQLSQDKIRPLSADSTLLNLEYNFKDYHSQKDDNCNGSQSSSKSWSSTISESSGKTKDYVLEHLLPAASAQTQKFLTGTLMPKASSRLRKANSFPTSQVKNVPELKGINDNLDSDSHGDPRYKPVTIVKNNEILDKTLEESTERSNDPSQLSFMSKLNHHMKAISNAQATSADITPIYKQGITNYNFDLDNAAELQQNKNNDLIERNSKPVTTDKTDEVPPASEGQSVEFHLSDSVNSSCDNDVKSSDTSASSSLRKSWGSFGPTLIKVFDRLLLEKTQVKEKCQDGNMNRLASSRSEPVSLNTAAKRRQLQEQKSIDNGHENSQNAGERESKAVTLRSGSAQLRLKREIAKATEVVEKCETLCSYSSTDSQELSFEKGATLVIVKDISDNYLQCSNGKQEGLVHKVCVKSVDKS